MSSAKYYWPLSNLENNITIGTRPGKVYGNITLTSGVKSMSNSSLQFVGPGAFIDAGNFGKECLTFPNACNSGLTVSFMASFDNETSKWKKRVYILDSVGDERNSVGLAVYVENKQLWFVVAGKYQFYMENIALDSDETWRHYAMRWNESAIYIYVNAQLSSTG